MNIDLYELQRVSRHEAGHWLIARITGFPTDGITRLAEEAGVEITLDAPIHDVPSLKRYLTNRCKVLIAGFVAENVQGGAVNPRMHHGEPWQTKSPYRQDRAKYNELLFVLSNLDAGQAGIANRQTLEDKIWKETTEILKDESDTLDAIASEVQNRPVSKKLTEAEITTIGAVEQFLARRGL